MLNDYRYLAISLSKSHHCTSLSPLTSLSANSSCAVYSLLLPSLAAIESLEHPISRPISLCVMPSLTLMILYSIPRSR